MLKWILGALVLVNLLIFTVLHWAKTPVDENNPLPQTPVNAEKIVLLKPEIISAPSASSSALNVVASHAVAANSASAPAALSSLTTAPSALLPPVALACLTWGELSGSNLQRAEKTLASWHWDTKIQQQSVEILTGYWVFIGPLRTRLAVDQKVLQLKARQVLDYFIVTEAGPWQNTISLGVFKTEDAAKKHLLKLQAQGVKTALIGAHGNKLKASVFHFKGLSEQEVTRVNGLLKAFPDSEIKPLPCP